MKRLTAQASRKLPPLTWVSNDLALRSVGRQADDCRGYRPIGPRGSRTYNIKSCPVVPPCCYHALGCERSGPSQPWMDWTNLDSFDPNRGAGFLNMACQGYFRPLRRDF